MWIGGFGVFSMTVLFGMVNGIYGRVLLTERGMQFRTLVSWRSIPWCEVAGVESRKRTRDQTNGNQGSARDGACTIAADIERERIRRGVTGQEELPDASTDEGEVPGTV